MKISAKAKDYRNEKSIYFGVYRDVDEGDLEDAFTRRSKLVEMIPLDAPSECPYNCVGCEHLNGVVYYGNDDVEVECDLDEEDGQ